MTKFLPYIDIREINASVYPRINYQSLCSPIRYTCHKENFNSISILNLIEFRLIQTNTDAQTQSAIGN